MFWLENSRFLKQKQKRRRKKLKINHNLQSTTVAQMALYPSVFFMFYDFLLISVGFFFRFSDRACQKKKKTNPSFFGRSQTRLERKTTNNCKFNTKSENNDAPNSNLHFTDSQLAQMEDWMRRTQHHNLKLKCNNCSSNMRSLMGYSCKWAISSSPIFSFSSSHSFGLSSINKNYAEIYEYDFLFFMFLVFKKVKFSGESK